VVYQADRSGRNSYGINIFPHINPLREEISHYPDFQFQDQYMLQPRLSPGAFP